MPGPRFTISPEIAQATAFPALKAETDAAERNLKAKIAKAFADGYNPVVLTHEGREVMRLWMDGRYEGAMQ